MNKAVFEKGCVQDHPRANPNNTVARNEQPWWLRIVTVSQEFISTENIPEKSANRAAINPILKLKEATPVLLLSPLLQASNKSNSPENNNAIGRLDINGWNETELITKRADLNRLS